MGNSNSIRPIADNIIKNWKLFAAVIVVLGGGSGTYAAFDFITCDEVDRKLTSVKESIEIKENERHTKLNKELANQFTKLNSNITDIQTVQHQDIAAREARRVTEKIYPLRKRLDEMDRIRRINLKRLFERKDPCSTVECSN